MKFQVFALLLAWSLPVFASNFHQLVEKDIDGKEFKMDTLKGKVVLVVNIASQCGFTPQLEDLQKLQTKYAARGFTVLGVPSNEFGEQTPENDQGMKEFCQKKYNVNFPLLSKGKVNGKERRPLYKFLTDQEKSKGDIGWNFVKFLVNKNGDVVDRWTSSTGPLADSVTKEIETNLK
ncbi:MAG: glutathione peroxidase [Bacteriovoracaceae bacterium]|nr:glutathione peroxidase [Bacteriovoracaceae bacterium]